MRRAAASLALCSAALAWVATAQEPAPDELRSALARARPRLDGQALERRARATLDLGLEVLRALPHGNVVVSPHAIAQTLGLAYAAASGDTARELGRVLRVEGSREEGLAALNALDLAVAARTGTGRAGTFRLRTAAAVWLQRGRRVRPEFLDAAATHFGVGAQTVDFAGDLRGARSTINRWLERAVGDRLEDLGRTSGPDGEVRLALTGATGLDAAWQTPFDPTRTTRGNFVSQGAGLFAVPLMQTTGRMAILLDDEVRAVDVPFAGDDLRLLVLVPQQGRVGELARSIDAARIANVLAQLRQPPRTVFLSLPRVVVETREDLREPLTRAGARTLFSSRADLAALDPDGGLRVTALLHAARVDLDEAGAGGASAVLVHARPALFMAPPPQEPPAGFDVNRPFLFLVHDRVTGAPLLLGRVMDPR